ncbi:phage portal protein [Planctomicrobium sp. SH668]|uniref:phage portal protein n=1 Tax=Planctomicrobium sp. SH668 TaxID=3448126 RepID=UPI003F5BE34D
MLHDSLLIESIGGPGITDPLAALSGSMGIDGGYFQPLSQIQDYADGDFRPHWFNLTMHSALRAEARMVCQAVTMSHNILDNLENYVVGQGFDYTVQSTSEVAGADKYLVDAVQRDLDRICRDNSFNAVDVGDGISDFGSLESQIHNRTRRDGEDFIAIFSPKKGEIDLRLVNAEHIVDPVGMEQQIEKQLGHRFAQSWKYGVHTAAHDIQKALGYFVQWDASGLETQYYPATEWLVATQVRSGLMHHIKRNVDVRVKRGLSDFFPVGRALHEDAKLTRNTVVGAQIQAAIAWIEQYVDENISKDKVLTEVNGSASPRQMNNVSPVNPDVVPKRKTGPGTVLVIPKGKEYKAGPMGAERNAGFSIVSRLSAQRIGIRWNMPEYMISGDASNGNYSSTEVAEGPFGKSRIKDQAFYGGHYRLILWKALTILAAQGYYAKYGVTTRAELRNRLKIVVNAPEVFSRDKLATAQANKILNDKGILSRRTWQAQADLDPDEETLNQEIDQEFVSDRGPEELRAPAVTESRKRTSQRISEESIREIAQRVQQTFWSDLNQKSEAYP